MTEQDKSGARLLRIEAVLQEVVKALQPFLPSKNGIASVDKESRVAFDLLERFYYHSRGVLLLFDEYKYNHNMALPLSQIFRAVAYDALVACWLFEEAGVFAERIKELNGDFVEKNNRRLSKLLEKGVISAEELQNTLFGWQHIAPDNLTTDSAGAVSVIPIPSRSFFERTWIDLGEKRDLPFIKSLPYAYAVLSQQAHFSDFSKHLIYNKQTDHAHLFDSICLSLLLVSPLLLSRLPESADVRGLFEQIIQEHYSAGE